MNTCADSISLFEEIKENCPNKNVTSLCNKLLKKLSFSSSKDVENLCHLTYWLYILEKIQLSKKCIGLTRDLVFDQNYNVWTFIHAMWGLEIRILRNERESEKAIAIAQTMDKQYKTPIQSSKETQERCEQREAKRREQFSFEFVSYQKEVSAADEKGANRWKFIALLSLIGKAETGLYPQLNDEREKIEHTIAIYIADIKKV